MKILSFDPSGTFKNGNGTTGWSIYDEKITEAGFIKAKFFEDKLDYFNAHKTLIEKIKPDLIIVENFILYQASMSALSNQEMETSELIGFIEAQGIKTIRQNASVIKGILSERPFIVCNILKGSELNYKIYKSGRTLWFYKGKQISNHIMDSIRHIAYYLAKEK